MKSSNVCQRCGKERILKKTWKEYLETSQVKSELTYTQYVCPDENCQRQVDVDINQKRIATAERERAANAREQARLQSRAKANKNPRNKQTDISH